MPISRVMDLDFPVLEMFHWRRVVFDEFHELESFNDKQQNSLQHLRASYRWGLTGTPPIDCNAGVIFMSSLFRIDIVGQPMQAKNLSQFEDDRLVGETASRFLDRYVRQNTAELPHIRLEEHVVLVHHTASERALYLGQAHDAADPSREDAFATEEKLKALENLLKLCSHFQAVGRGVANAQKECHRIGAQKERRVVHARSRVARACQALLLLQVKGDRAAACHAAFWEQTTVEDEYKITLAREEGVLLGIIVVQSVVEAVHGGLVGKWNEEHPDMKVKAGDRILEVGGVRGGVIQLSAESVMEQAELELKLQRGSVARSSPWLVQITAALHKLRAKGEGPDAPGCRTADVFDEELHLAYATPPAARLKALEGYRTQEPILLGHLGDPGGPRAFGREAGHSHEQWLAFAQKAVTPQDLAAMIAEQVKEQVQNLKELRDAFASLEFFRRTLAALEENSPASAATRSCTVCLEEDLPVARLAITPCAHTFCLDCLRATVGRHKSCAICRHPLTEKDIRPISSELENRTAGAGPAGLSSACATSSASSSGGVSAHEGGPEDAKYRKHQEKHGTKLAALVKKLRELRSADPTAKVILFVQFDDLKLKVSEALQECEVPVVQLQGSTDCRGRIIRDWQENSSSDSFVLLLSLAQSASGTNLTAASHVVFLHPMLAATAEKASGYELQAIGRARRHGQLRDVVHVWRFVTADTVEQQITQRHQAVLGAREELPPSDPAAAAVPMEDGLRVQAPQSTPAAAAVPMEDRLRVGARAKIVDLRSDPSLNGHIVKLMQFHADDRPLLGTIGFWEVRLEGPFSPGRSVKVVMPRNLEVVGEEDEDAGGCAMSDDSDDERLRAGARARIVGIAQEPNLNGHRGILMELCTAPECIGRWQVRLEEPFNGEYIYNFKPQNLEIVDDEDEDMDGCETSDDSTDEDDDENDS